MLPGQQNAALTGINSQARQALAGYGGYTWGVDDPNTPENEGLNLDYDASKGLGQKEKGAYRGARDNANSGGMLESSFANQNIASAVQRMTLEGQQMATQYAAALNQTYTDYAKRASDLTREWAGYFGADSAWLVDNPPPKPADWMAPAGTVGDVWAGYHDPDPAGLESMYPGMSFSYRTDPDGRVVVTASPKPQAAVTPTAAASQRLGRDARTWTGTSAPKIATLSSAWGVPANKIRVEKRDGRYVAYIVGA